MKYIIINALKKALKDFEKTIPTTKKEIVYVNIEDVEPINILKFIEEKNIPKECWFSGKPNGYDSFDYVCLCYEKVVPFTESDKRTYILNKFKNFAWKYVYNAFIENNFKRTSLGANFYSKYKLMNIYDSLIKKEYDYIFDYYSSFFIKKDDDTKLTLVSIYCNGMSVNVFSQLPLINNKPFIHNKFIDEVFNEFYQYKIKRGETISIG